MADSPEQFDPAIVALYAIYDHPSDHPDSFVVREWVFIEGASQPGDAREAENLEAARALVPPNSTRVSGTEADEPTIVEVWLGPGRVQRAPPRAP